MATRRVHADRKPADSVPFSVSMPRPVYEQLRVLAAKEDRTISGMLRRLVERALREAKQS
jgi:predicted DNA-binding protein